MAPWAVLVFLFVAGAVAPGLVLGLAWIAAARGAWTGARSRAVLAQFLCIPVFVAELLFLAAFLRGNFALLTPWTWPFSYHLFVGYGPAVWVLAHFLRRRADRSLEEEFARLEERRRERREAERGGGAPTASGGGPAPPG